MKNIFVFGTSMSEYRYTEKKLGDTKWCQVVANKIGFDNVQYRGEGATGNNRIAFNVFDQVLKYHDKMDLVLIWWANWLTESMFCGDYNFTSSLMKYFKFNETQKDQASNQHQAFIKALTSYNYKNLPFHIVNRNIVDNYIKTQKILEHYDIPYIMIQGHAPLMYWYPELGDHSEVLRLPYGTLTTVEEEQKLKEIIKYDKILELIEKHDQYINEKTFIWYPGIPELGGTNWNYKNAYESGFNEKYTRNDDGKPTQEGHDYIASLFIERYNKLYK